VERATRERLTGAVILVAALAILVPEMLSGPGGADVPREPVADTGPPLTTYDLTIDSSAPASRQQQLSSVTSQAQSIAEAVPPPVTAPPPQADVAEEPSPEPAGGSASVAEPATPPAATQSRPVAAGNDDSGARGGAGQKSASSTAVTESRATAPPAKPAANAASGWWVQLGSFSSAQNAQQLARKLRAQGFSIDVSVVRSGGKDLHRVRAGPEKDRAAASALRSRLAAAGQKEMLIGP